MSTTTDRTVLPLIYRTSIEVPAHAYESLLARLSGPGVCAAADGVRLTAGTPEAAEYEVASCEYDRLMKSVAVYGQGQVRTEVSS